MAPHPALSPRRWTGNVNGAGRGIKGEGPCFFHTLRESLHRVRSSAPITASLPIHLRAQHTDKGEVPITLCMVQAIAHHEQAGNEEADVMGPDLFNWTGRFVRQDTNLDAEGFVFGLLS